MGGVFKAIGNAVSGVVKAVVGAVSSVVKAVVNIASSVLNFVLQPFMGLLGGMGGMPDGAQEAQRQDGVLIQRTGSNVSIPVVYGMRKVGGIVTFAETGADNNQYLWVAYALSEGPIEGLRELYINDYQIDNKYITAAMLTEGAVVDITDGKYKDRVRLQFYPGTYYSDPTTSSIGTDSILKDSPSWKDSMVYNGLAVLFVRYYWKKVETQADADANPFSGSIPEIKATLLGRKVASLVITNPESYTYSTAPIRYSTNPAEILLDYLRNPRYGKGLFNDDLDWSTWRVACSKANTEITYVTGIKGPILTCNFVLDTAQSIFANTKTLLMGFRAYMPYVQGKYKLKIEDAGHPTDITSGAATIYATFDQDNIQGNVTFTGIDRGNKYNQVAVTYVDPDQAYSTQIVIYPEEESERQTYITQDGNRENKLDVTFPTITNYAIAKDMARMLFNKSRRQETCSLTVTSQGIELEPGDNIRIQSNILDFGTDPWRVITVKINDDMTVELGCVRNPDDIYPHTRVGQNDIVLPPFIPKGSTIYYPTSNNAIPIGLVPPAFVPGYNATNPNTASGGGVGGSGGSVNTTPVTTPSILVPLDLVDKVELDRVTYRAEGTQIYASLEFLQPDHVMYDSVDMYYKGQGDNGYRKVIITDKPGPGQRITFVLGPLIPRIYYFTFRVKYSTGEYSRIITESAINGEDQRVTYPSDSISIVSDGWTLPPFTPTIVRNNVPQYVLASRPGTGTPPARSLTINTQQNVRTTSAETPNYDINGVKIYYKAAASEYWYEYTYAAPVSYLPGDTITFPLNTNLGNTGDAESYDFVFRFTYRDGRESTRQIRYMGAPIQTGNSSNVFIPIPLSNIYTEESASFEIKRIVDYPGAVGTPTDLTLSVAYVFAFTATSTQSANVRFGINVPDAANLTYWRGFRLYHRPYAPTSNPQWTYQAQTNVTTEETVSSQALVSVKFDVSGLPRDGEWLVVPLVRSGSVTVEATNGWYFNGIINSDASTGAPTQTFASTRYGTKRNWKETLSPALRNIAEVRSSVQAVKLQTDPTAQIINWKMEILVGNRNGWSAGTTSQNMLGIYYELDVYVDHIVGSFQDLKIYRRMNRTDMPPAPTGTAYRPNAGVGRWEFLTRTKVQMYTYNNSAGQAIYRIRLRTPITYQEYGLYTTSQAIEGTYSSQGVLPIGVPTPYDEFLIVVRQTGNVESAKGILLKGSWRSYTASTINLLANQPVTEVTVSSYNTGYTAGYNREISNARSAITSANYGTQLQAVACTSDAPMAPNRIGIQIPGYLTNPSTLD